MSTIRTATHPGTEHMPGTDRTPQTPHPTTMPDDRTEAEVLSDTAAPSTPEELAAQWEAESVPPAGGLANLFACLVTAGLGVVGMILSASLGLGAPTDPGAGLFPFAMACATTVLSIVQIVVGRRGGDGEKFVPASWTVLYGLTSLLAFVALMPVIGFEIPGVLLAFAWMKFLGGETWRSAALWSLVVVAAFYAIFVLALGTQIPHLL